MSSEQFKSRSCSTIFFRFVNMTHRFRATSKSRKVAEAPQLWPPRSYILSIVVIECSILLCPASNGHLGATRRQSWCSTEPPGFILHHEMARDDLRDDHGHKTQCIVPWCVCGSCQEPAPRQYFYVCDLRHCFILYHEMARDDLRDDHEHKM